VENAARAKGGAICNNAVLSGESSPVITNGSFFGNRAEDGGAVFNETSFVGGGTVSPVITNSILWANSASASGNQMYNLGGGTAPTLGHTLLEGGLDAIAENQSSTIDGGGNLDADPQFVDESAPAGPDGTFGTADDGLRLYAGSPAAEAGDGSALPADASDLDGDGDTSEPLPVDLAGANRVQDGAVDLGAYEGTATVPLALTDGSAQGLDFSAAVAPGTDDNPVGLFALSGAGSGAVLNAVTVTNRAPGVEGIRAARLYWSADQTLEPGSDTELGTVTTDATSAPATIAFTGFSQAIPTAPGYAIIALDVAGGATATGVQFELAQESDLSAANGTIATVNGTSQATFSALPLSGGTTALPVEFAAFDGAAAGERVRLTWQTASETNNAGFEIQRRTIDKADEEGSSPTVKASRRDASTGREVWQMVGSVEGSGTTNEPQSYRFEDTDLPYAADSLTYRLRQVDTDGSASYSEALTVARRGVEAAELLGTAPNPARSHTTVRFAVPAGAEGRPVRLALYDLLGRRVHVVRTAAAAGRHELRLPTNRLPSGVYFLRLQVGSTVKTQKLTVVR
jgi:hypothetical protein